MASEPDGFTAEERAVLAVALETVPYRHEAVGVSVHGDHAWVCTTPTRARDPGDDWDIYDDWVDIGLVRQDGEWQVWHHSSGGWVSWWSPDGYEEGALGVLALVGGAPPPARAAEIRFQGQTSVVPVRHGSFFFAIWDQPEPYPPSKEELEEMTRGLAGGEAIVDTITEVDPGEWERMEAERRATASDETKVPVLVRLLD